jgi:hypothetical protein
VQPSGLTSRYRHLKQRRKEGSDTGAGKSPFVLPSAPPDLLHQRKGGEWYVKCVTRFIHLLPLHRSAPGGSGGHVALQVARCQARRGLGMDNLVHEMLAQITELKVSPSIREPAREIAPFELAAWFPRRRRSSVGGPGTPSQAVKGSECPGL